MFLCFHRPLLKKFDFATLCSSQCTACNTVNSLSHRNNSAHSNTAGSKMEYTTKWKYQNWTQLATCPLPTYMWLICVTRSQVWMRNRFVTLITRTQGDNGGPQEREYYIRFHVCTIIISCQQLGMRTHDGSAAEALDKMSKDRCCYQHQASHLTFMCTTRPWKAISAFILYPSYPS